MLVPGDITGLISQWRSGNKSAENELFESLYRALHTMALQCLRSEPISQTLSATGLVHEAYLRLVRSDQLSITDREHLLSLLARVMRRVVVDRARARRAGKRAVVMAVVDDLENLVQTDEDADEQLAVDQALDRLAEHSPRLAHLVELRHFGGYTEEESALALGVSLRTVRRDWDVARTRLRMAIDGDGRQPARQS